MHFLEDFVHSQQSSTLDLRLGVESPLMGPSKPTPGVKVEKLCLDYYITNNSIPS